jgi:hypothetical protein
MCVISRAKKLAGISSAIAFVPAPDSTATSKSGRAFLMVAVKLKQRYQYRYEIGLVVMYQTLRWYHPTKAVQQSAKSLSLLQGFSL